MGKLTKKVKVIGLILMALLAFSTLISAAPGPAPQERDFAPGRILVKFKPRVSPSKMASVHRAQGGRPIRWISGIDVQVVEIPMGAEKAKAAAYARSPIVAYAEPDYIAQALGDPSDEYFAKQWGLDNDGQVYKDGQSGMVDADIDALEAWDIITGTVEIKIAILDTGIDQDHPDLDDKLAGNKNCTNSPTIDDLYGHGTHVAGIAAAETNNTQGVAGVGYSSSLLNVKVLNDDAIGYHSWIADGIVWATDNGAKVINMSLGGKRKSSTLEEAVNYAWNGGVVLAAAAGNDGNPSPLYPAKYVNCIAVAATDSNDEKASFSQWGDWVDVAAPGVDIFSTFPYTGTFKLQEKYDRASKYDFGNGTSMSTPFVSGLAALVWATEYGTSNSAVRDRIETMADSIPGTGQYWIHGRINACNAVGGNCSYEGVQPTPTPTPTATPTPTPVPGGKMHVADITMDLATVQRGPNPWTYAIATVTILDEGDLPVEGATVSGHWSEATSDSDSGVTGADGKVSLESDKVKNALSGTAFTFTVDDVALSGWTYDSSANTETTDSISVQ